MSAGLVDELLISLSPVIFGAGTAVFEDVDAGSASLEIAEVIDSPLVTHLRYSLR